jgi:hypothetical protein
MFVASTIIAVLLALAMLTSARTKLTRHERVYVRMGRVKDLGQLLVGLLVRPRPGLGGR